MSRPAPYALGIDIGGTKTSFAIVDVTSGGVAEEKTIPTPQGDASGVDFLQRVETTARELIAHSSVGSVSALGLGICELVDRDGRVVSGHRVFWKGLPIKERLSLIAPSAIESDVRAAALAEARFGAGRHFPDFLFLNIGTGVSTCWVKDGEPHAGAHGHALVVASAPTTTLCPVCGKLHDIVLEDMAGGAGLIMRYHKMTGIAVVDAGGVISRAEAGDSTATRIIADAAAMLGSAIGLAIGMLDPHALVIGGGIGSADNLYVRSLEMEARRHIWSDETRKLPILRAALGADAGVVGAALSAYQAQGISSPKLR
jgi:glucokinase